MKAISTILTTLFFLLMAVPTFADDSNQNNQAYEQAHRRIEQHNANLQQEYEKTWREFEAKREAYKRKTEQRDANFQKEYEKAMREYNAKVRANQNLLQRVEKQYPGIKLDAAEAVKKKSTKNIPGNESSANENTSRTRKYKKNTSQADSPREKRLQRARQRQRSFTTRHISKSQSVSRGQKSSGNASISKPINPVQSRNNTGAQRQYEKQKREYERQVKAYEAKKQKEVEKHNAELRKEYERQRAEVEKYNAKVNEMIRKNQAEVAARMEAEAKAQLERRTQPRSSKRKPYLGNADPHRPFYMREPYPGWIRDMHEQRGD